MIIFGSRGYVYQLAILTLLCGQCGNPSAHTLRKHVTKFTLFFVPLFPFSTKYTTQCTFCGASGRMNKEQADQLLVQSTAGQDGHAYGQGGNGQSYGPGQGGQGQAYGQPGPQNPYQS